MFFSIIMLVSFNAHYYLLSVKINYFHHEKFPQGSIAFIRSIFWITRVICGIKNDSLITLNINIQNLIFWAHYQLIKLGQQILYTRFLLASRLILFTDIARRDGNMDKLFFKNQVIISFFKSVCELQYVAGVNLVITSWEI